MKKVNNEQALKKVNYMGANGMSVCNSCASCGCGGSTCQSTCKCFDQNGKIEDVKEIYSK